MGLPIIVLDFDGVIHSYISGWKGPRKISDPVVPGSMEFLYMAIHHFDISIVSSRSHYFLGRRAMKNYIKNNMEKYIKTLFKKDDDGIPEWAMNDAEEILYIETNIKLNEVMNSISFPKHKPPAFLTIDDRAITFKGEWPTIEEIRDFKPWNK